MRQHYLQRQQFLGKKYFQAKNNKPNLTVIMGHRDFNYLSFQRDGKPLMVNRLPHS